MFTGIVQSTAEITEVTDHNGIRTFVLKFQQGFCTDLEVGASVAVDGVCLTVTALVSEISASFDVILQSLRITTLSQLTTGAQVNVERAAKDGAEIGGHPLSGHIDFNTPIADINYMDDNCRVRLSLAAAWEPYVFPKGYIALNGASLTVSQVNKTEGWFEVWLIPETRRVTTFSAKQVGDAINVEIERGTQVIVDTVRATIQESLGEWLPLLEKTLAAQGVDIDTLGQRIQSRITQKS